jgi:hypothetical protein
MIAASVDPQMTKCNKGAAPGRAARHDGSEAAIMVQGTQHQQITDLPPGGTRPPQQVLPLPQSSLPRRPCFGSLARLLFWQNLIIR